jgi:5'(3')-deoxyribonucleotidase
MKILIDCDGVLSNFSSMFVEIAKTQFGIDARLSDGENWDLFDYPEVKERKEDIWKHILSTPGLIRGLDKFDYADELVSELRKLGDVICVTSVVFGGTYADERIAWLVEEMGFDRYDIILAYRKYMIEGDVLIDDKPANVSAWADRWFGEGGIPILWQPPSRGFSSDDDRLLVTGDVDRLINRLKWFVEHGWFK